MATRRDAEPSRGDGSDARGLYVHIPFCARRCHFCDFVTGPDGEGRAAAYLDALLAEARAERAALPAVPPLETLYLGGGTPSLVEPGLLSRFLDALGSVFPLAPGAEATIEANPEDVTDASLDAYRAAGLNRLSVGVQSLETAALTALNRGHTAEQGLAAIRRARARGWDDVSADLMLATPGATIGGTLEGAARLAAEGITHLSAYALTLEEKSVFGRRARHGGHQEAEDDVFVRLYYGVIDRAEREGLARYEISNFARPGRRSRHNTNYWRRGSWLALGVGAVGEVGGERWRNAASIEAYSRRGGSVPREWDPRGREARATEAIFLALRQAEGLDVPALAAEFGAGVLRAINAPLARLVTAGLLERTGERVRLSRRGLLVSDFVFSELALLDGDLEPAPRAARIRVA